jgi:zinc protease
MSTRKSLGLVSQCPPPHRWYDQFGVVVGLACVLLGLAANIGDARALTVDEVVSAKGVRAWLVEEHSVPLVAIRFAFEGGAAQDPTGKEGLAAMMSDLLTESAGALSAEAFKERLSGLGARLSVSGTRDAVHGRLETLSKHLRPSAELLKLALVSPRFDADAVDRVRAQRLTDLALAASNSTSVALDRWYAVAFPGQAYSRPVNGTPDSLQRLTREDMKAQRARLFGKDVLKVVIVGDVDKGAAAEILDLIFGGLPMRARLAPVERIEPRPIGAPVVVTQDLPLATAAFGLASLSPDHPDFPALQVLNHIIGSGDFDSSLMEEVRIKRGLAYSIRTSLVRDSVASVLLGGFSTRNETMGTALGVLRDVLASAVRDGPTPSQLENAKRYLTGSFLLDFDTTEKAASSLLAIRLDGHGPDYLATRNQGIERVTTDDVRRVAGEVLKPDRLIVTIVGRPQLAP